MPRRCSGQAETFLTPRDFRHGDASETRRNTQAVPDGAGAADEPDDEPDEESDDEDDGVEALDELESLVDPPSDEADEVP